MKIMKKVAVFTSGGDAPGMNACIRAVVRTAIHYGYEAVGIRRGYEGMIDGDFVELKQFGVSNIIQLGGTILQSARSERFRTVEGRQEAYRQLIAADIDGVVAIGGDGTFTGANIFLKEFPEIRFIGIPGTIDNDLFGTDYTIGYDTAINTAMNAIDNIKDTANAHNRLFFVEVMGRDAGFIALRSGIATGAEAVLVPESKKDTNHLFSILEKNLTQNKMSNIVVVAEGDEAGGAFKMAEKVREKFNNQFDIRVTILGHVQRGGRPTCMERVLASRLGMESVRALMDGKTGLMVGEVDKKIVFTPFEKAIKHHEDLNSLLLDMVEILS
ncbi:MAG: 6-phosphofructokinase [Saprospiraceae bacterium]|nr:6-phosphofructokinase [Saprospiraceae bacterium]